MKIFVRQTGVLDGMRWWSLKREAHTPTVVRTFSGNSVGGSTVYVEVWSPTTGWQRFARMPGSPDVESDCRRAVTDVAHMMFGEDGPRL